MTTRPSTLAVNANSADFVWHADDAIAVHASRGWRVKVVCLPYGKRGESAKLWRNGSITLEMVKAAQRQTTETAADILGVEIDGSNLSDYLLRLNGAAPRMLRHE